MRAAAQDLAATLCGPSPPLSFHPDQAPKEKKLAAPKQKDEVEARFNDKTVTSVLYVLTDDDDDSYTETPLVQTS